MTFKSSSASSPSTDSVPSPSNEGPTPPPVKTVYDSDNDEGTVIDDDSTVGSNYDFDPDSAPTERVVLYESHCRVMTTTTPTGHDEQVTRACANEAKTCSRKGHKAQRAANINVAPPGSYM